MLAFLALLIVVAPVGHLAGVLVEEHRSTLRRRIDSLERLTSAGSQPVIRRRRRSG